MAVKAHIGAANVMPKPKLPPEFVVKKFGSLGEWFKPAVLKTAEDASPP
jgi:hypothetical protein